MRGVDGRLDILSKRTRQADIVGMTTAPVPSPDDFFIQVTSSFLHCGACLMPCTHIFSAACDIYRIICRTGTQMFVILLRRPRFKYPIDKFCVGVAVYVVCITVR